MLLRLVSGWFGVFGDGLAGGDGWDGHGWSSVVRCLMPWTQISLGWLDWDALLANDGRNKLGCRPNTHRISR